MKRNERDAHGQLELPFGVSQYEGGEGGGTLTRRQLCKGGRLWERGGGGGKRRGGEAGERWGAKVGGRGERGGGRLT